MSREICVRPAAEQDILQAYRWYEERQYGLGAAFVLDVDAAMERILRDPLIYREMYRGIRRSILKKFPYGILYRVTDPEIQILAVFHLARDPEVWDARI